MKKILSNPTYAVLAAIFCNILWGSAYPGIKSGYALFNIADSLFSKILFAGIRFSIAGLMVLLYTAVTRKKLPVIPKKNILSVSLIALVYTVFQYIFFYVGLSNTTGTNGSIVNSTSTFMTAIIAHFLYKDDKLNVMKVIGLIMGFAGVLSVTASGGSSSFTLKGEGLVMLAALCFVIGSVLIKKLAADVDPASLTGYNLFFGGLALMVIGTMGGGHFEQVNTHGILVLAYLALLSAAAYTLWSALVAYNPVGKISAFNFIIPVSGTILSAIFLNENIFDIKYLISLVLVCAGIIIVNKGGAK